MDDTDLWTARIASIVGILVVIILLVFAITHNTNARNREAACNNAGGVYASRMDRGKGCYSDPGAFNQPIQVENWRQP